MRCNTSGRLTPAAATRISTSPGPGCGTGRVCGCKTSGPPGSLMAMAVISAGTLVTWYNPPLVHSFPHPCPALLTVLRHGSTVARLFGLRIRRMRVDDDDLPRRRDDV